MIYSNSYFKKTNFQNKKKNVYKNMTDLSAKTQLEICHETSFRNIGPLVLKFNIMATEKQSQMN